MKAVRPLPVAGTEFVVYGEEQSEYEPLPALRTRDTVSLPPGSCPTRSAPQSRPAPTCT